MKTWKLVIDDIFPTANVLTRMPRLRRGQRHYPGCTRHLQDLRDWWYWALLEHVALHGGGISPATKKRHVKVTSYRRGDPDPQNMMLGADKLVADNLVKLGVLVNDNKRWCKLEADAERAGKLGKRTVIEIREG
jgi:hypothetical protein